MGLHKKNLCRIFAGVSAAVLMSAGSEWMVQGDPIFFPSGPETQLGYEAEVQQTTQSAETTQEQTEEVSWTEPEIMLEEMIMELSSQTDTQAAETQTIQQTEPPTEETTLSEVTLPASPLPPEKSEDGKVLINVPYINQSEQWPTGCESVTAVMLLNYLGVDISVDTFVEQCLVSQPMDYRENTIYGPDPRKAFAGSPYDSEAFGCYAPVIVNALDSAFASFGTDSPWQAIDLTGASMEDLLTDFIDQGLPVIFWATIDLHESLRGPSWTIPETGGTFIWTSFEHCMLLVGYDDQNYYFNDPWNNHGVIGYDRALVEQRHKELFYMAVGIRKI